MAISDDIKVATIAIDDRKDHLRATPDRIDLQIKFVIVSRGMKVKKTLLSLFLLFFRFRRRRGCLICDDFVEKLTI